MHIADKHREESPPSTAEKKAVPSIPDARPSAVPSKTPSPLTGSRPNAFESLLHASKKRISKVLFYLEYNDGKLHPRIFLNGEAGGNDTDTMWSCTVKLRNFSGRLTTDKKAESGCTLVLATNMAPVAVSPAPEQPMSSGDVSLLKSMIQKGFRRCMTAKSSRLAVELLMRNPDEFLRRVPIIIVEDGLLHAGLPILVWLMIACSKGYAPPPVLLSVCMQIYVESLGSRMLDCINYAPQNFDFTRVSRPPSPVADEKRVAEKGVHIVDIPATARRTLVVSLLLRASYGGMDCDISLLNAAATCWAHRLTSDTCESAMSAESPTSLYLHHDYCSEVSSVQYGNVTFQCTNVPDSGDGLLRGVVRYPLSKKQSLVSGFEALESMFDSSNRQATENKLPPITDSLIEEGIDFHCDSKMIPFIMSGIRGSNDLDKWLRDHDIVGVEMLESTIKTLIWTFRSSTNIRQLFSPTTAKEREVMESYTAQQLSEKKKYAALWRIVCPVISAYCSRRIGEMNRFGL